MTRDRFCSFDQFLLRNKANRDMGRGVPTRRASRSEPQRGACLAFPFGPTETNPATTVRGARLPRL